MLRPRASSILWGIVLAGGLSISAVGSYQAWEELAPVRNSHYFASEFPIPISTETIPTVKPVPQETEQPAEQPDVRVKVVPNNPRFRGVIYLPAISQKYEVFEGTTSAELSLGVGHMVSTNWPGAQGNIVLAGHRETVFRDIGQLAKDDLIHFEIAGTTHTYKVTKFYIVDEGDRSVTRKTSFERLVLVTCYPFTTIGWSPSRYIVVARPI